MNDKKPNPGRIETENCFVIKSLYGDYIIGSPEFVGALFHSRYIEDAINMFSFDTKDKSDKIILLLEQQFDFLKKWCLVSVPAYKLKAEPPCDYEGD